MRYCSAMHTPSIVSREVLGRLSCGRVVLWIFSGFLLLLLPGATQASMVHSGQHHWLSEDTLLVRFGVQINLSDVVLEAITNGIPVYLRSELRMEQRRLLLPDSVEVQGQRSFRLAYSALSRHYVLTDLSRDSVVLVPTLGDALEVAALQLGRVTLTVDPLPDSAKRRVFAARVMLEHSALPLPLQWDPRVQRTQRTGGGWYRWPLQ